MAPTDQYLYVIEFTDGVVKVGRTGRLNARIKEHRRAAKVIGLGIRNGWIEGDFTLSAVVRVERELIAYCADSWPLVQGLEYFAAPFDEVADFADVLTAMNRDFQQSAAA